MFAYCIKTAGSKIKIIYEKNQVGQENQIKGNKDDLYER